MTTDSIITVRTNAPDIVARIFFAGTVVVVGTAHAPNETTKPVDLTAFACPPDKIKFGDRSLLLDGNHVYLPADSLGRAVAFLREHGINAGRWVCD